MHPNYTPSPFDALFEKGDVPMDEPPGFMERAYKLWKEAGGKVTQPHARSIAKLADFNALVTECLEEIKWLQARNRELLGACQSVAVLLDGLAEAEELSDFYASRVADEAAKVQAAIAKAEGRS